MARPYESKKDRTGEHVVRSHRQIAEMLGIGRARVFYLEHQAMDKIKKIFLDSGIERFSDIDEVPVLKLPPEVVDQVPQERFSPQHGWLKCDSVVSLNEGSVCVDDVVRSYRFLKELHDELMRPTVVIKNNLDVRRSFVIQAVGEENGDLFVRCWPESKNSKRSVRDLCDLRCTVIVESEFGVDVKGDFDIPVIVCVILSEKKMAT